ncbi:MAG: type II secretion system protein [Planctomycetota bacterium]
MNIRPGHNRLRRPPRPSFTLAELLVVIAIIGVVASMTLFSFYGVREDARERRARAQVTKIHELIMRQWESYRTRPVPVERPPNLRFAAQKRLYALRELMRMELPDRSEDLTEEYRYLDLDAPPSLCRAYQRRAVSSWTPEHESAECLYLILATMRDGGTTGLDFFPEDEIGDVDGDGMPEILDPWGVPIRFLRWAPGFQSDIQTGPRDGLGDDDSFNPDPFDPLKVDPRWEDDDPSNDPFALYPLVVSAGRDGEFNEFGWGRRPPDEHDRYDDPYDGARMDLGSPGPASSDNITNHFLEVR